MILVRCVSPFLGENCYVLGNEQTGSAVVVDPGVETADQARTVMENHGLTLSCVLLTHGHPDHVWDAANLAGDSTVFVSHPDAYRLDDPLGALGSLGAAREALGPWNKPTNVQILGTEFFRGTGAPLAPGIVIRALAGPGHSEGCTIYFLAGQWGTSVTGMAEASDDTSLLALTGDVLFRSGVGRTDLPGGDDGVMQATLRTLTQVVDPATMVFPGHGPASTMERELASNPFLRK